MSTPGGAGQYPPGPQGPQGGGPPIDPATGRPYGEPLGAVGYGAEPPAKRSMTWFWVGAVVAVIAVGAGAYLFGYSKGEDQYAKGTAKYNDIYNAGVASGQKGGLAIGTAAGQKQGQKEGLAKGVQQGKEQGVAQGTADGASAALGGFTQWNTNQSFYVVTMKTGTQKDVPYEIASRVLMNSTLYYSPCVSSPDALCTFPRPTSGGGSSTTTTPTTTTTTGG